MDVAFPLARSRGAIQEARALRISSLFDWPGSSPVTGPPVWARRRCGGSPAVGRRPSFPLALRPEGSRPRGMVKGSGSLLPRRLRSVVQPFAIDGDLLALEAEGFVELLRTLVSLAYHEFELGRTA